MLCRAANWSFFKREPLSGTTWFGYCRASKCPFHVSSLNQTCAALRAVYITNKVQIVYRYVIAEHTSAVLSFMHMTQEVWFTGKTFNHSVDSWNKVLHWCYRSTIHHTLHTTLQKIAERCQIRWLCWLCTWSTSTNPSIWICNIELILHISIKVCCSCVCCSRITCWTCIGTTKNSVGRTSLINVR